MSFASEIKTMLQQNSVQTPCIKIKQRKHFVPKIGFNCGFIPQATDWF